MAQFDAGVTGNSFLIDDAGVLLAPGQYDTNASGFTYSGGTVTFGGTSGILEIEAPIENTVAKLFGDTIAGFQSGDEIALRYYIVGSLGTWSQQLVWTQADHTLDLYNVFTEAGVQSKSLEAAFTLTGTYSASSFKISDASWNGEVDSAASLLITTTQSASAPASAVSAAAAPAVEAASATDLAAKVQVFSQLAATSLVAPSSGLVGAAIPETPRSLTLAIAGH